MLDITEVTHFCPQQRLFPQATEVMSTCTLRFALLASAFASLLLSRELAAQTTFTDVSVQAGFTGNIAGWSAAWGDYDQDGRADVVTLPHNLAMYYGATGRLWHNNPDGTFTDVSTDALLDIKGDLHSAAWGDFDGDGDLDLIIIKGSPKTYPIHYNDLWENQGDLTFRNIAVEAGVIGIRHRGRGAYSLDYDRDGDLDLFSTSFNRSPYDLGNLLLRNDGAMSFVDVAPAAGIDRRYVDNRSAAWADYDGDQLMDLFLGSPCALFRHRPDHTFEDVTVAAGITPSDECWNMAFGDYNGDGAPDLYVNMTEKNQGILYRNDGDGTFTDVTTASGILNAPSGGNAAQGVVWGDYDNDGFIDIYIVNGDDVTPNRLFRIRPFQITTAAAGKSEMAKKFIGLELEEFAVPIVEASAAVGHHSLQSGSAASLRPSQSLSKLSEQVGPPHSSMCPGFTKSLESSQSSPPLL